MSASDSVTSTADPSLVHRDVPGLICALLLAGWIVASSLAANWILWTAEQFSIIDNTVWPIWAWPVASIVHAVALFVPALLLGWLWRKPRYRAVFQTWTLSAAFILFLAPARLAPPNQALLAGLLQIAGALAYLGFVLAWIALRARRGGPRFVVPRSPYLLALALVPLLAWGWIAWGALGSIADILVNGASALLFGLAIGLVAGHFAIGQIRRASVSPGRDVTLDSLTIGVSLVAMASGFGFNGQQLTLMLVLLLAGRLLAITACVGRVKAEEGWAAISLLAGLTVAFPMWFIDPDELVLVLNTSAGELSQWNTRAALVTAASAWILGIILTLLHRSLVPGPERRRRARIALAVALWAAIAILYSSAGQPGLYGDRVFVILRDQADVSTATGMADSQGRRASVYRTLVRHADDSQAEIRGTLDRLGVDYTPYYLVNALEVDAGPLLQLWLGRRPEVDRVLLNPVLRPLPAPLPTAHGSEGAPAAIPWNLASIGADRVQTELGITGTGVVIGQSDSGAQWDHPELHAAYRGSTTGSHDYNWLDPWNYTPEPTDFGGHGTHTLGSIVGQTVGVAPGATWYACVNLARNLGSPARYLDCMQFMLAPFPMDGDPFRDGQPEMGANVLNNSWGCPDIEGCDAGTFAPAIRALRSAGLFVVSSAGNEGDRCGSVSAPIALYDESFSVGAFDSSGRVAFFSSRGPVTVDGSNRIKPDIVAPGVHVLSAYPGGTYSYADGTSMAGPHVVGVVALVWSANPALIGDIDRTEAILTETARPYDYARLGAPACAEGSATPNNAVGHGLIDAYAAVKRALQERTDIQ